ncbi:MAG: hypothetical protein KKD44_28440 [Proteobacteria bacterium]|nr:hypothetical protein [Pseudomonadota bacterium]
MPKGIVYTCPECGKEDVKSLRRHYRSSHPDMDIPDILKPANEVPAALVPETEVPVEESSMEPKDSEKPNPLDKLRFVGIEPEEIMAAFSPLVEASVVKTLEKLQLGEFINKKIDEATAKLSEQVKPLTDLASQVQDSQTSSEPSNGKTGNQALGDQILPLLVQRFIAPPSNGMGNMEQITKLLGLAQSVSDAVNKPRMEERVATRREISETLKMLRDAGASPEKARDTIIGQIDANT